MNVSLKYQEGNNCDKLRYKRLYQTNKAENTYILLYAVVRRHVAIDN